MNEPDALPLPPPLVSILVAARNEQDSIVRCLRSLDALHYPTDRYEVLVGNDQSTDRTELEALNYMEGKSHFRYFPISEQTAGLRGKANVLAQLARQSRGEYLFFCDADIAVRPSWVRSLLDHFTSEAGVVVGVTRMARRGSFAGLQSLEWLFFLTLMRFFSLVKVPFTGMGNNMAVRREAYFEVGGYETLGFSIVEDFALFMKIIEKRDFVQGFRTELLSESVPTETLRGILHQRKRWVKGAMAAPLLIRLSFIASALLLPVLLALGFLFPSGVVLISVLHYGLVTAVSLTGLLILRQYDLLKYLPFFWLYFNANNTLMLFNYLLPYPTTWKGRVYE